MTLTSHYVTLTSQKTCKYNNKFDAAKQKVTAIHGMLYMKFRFFPLSIFDCKKLIFINNGF